MELLLVGRRSLLCCEAARRKYSVQTARTRGLSPMENVVWRERTLDVTESWPVEWGPWSVEPRHVEVRFTGQVMRVLREDPETFDQTWRLFLARHPFWQASHMN